MSETAELPKGTVVVTDVPSRLDRLEWSGWHWRVVLALGITWTLDGLESSLIANLGPVLEEPTTLGLTATEVGGVNTAYLVGQVVGALVFGRLTDKLGRRKLFFVTLAVYLGATALAGLAPNLLVLAVLRFFAGTGIGGEYSAINSAIDEVIPARVRGRVDLAVNGSYWIGVALGAALTEVFLDPRLLPHAIGWRLVFLLGAVLGLGILILRRDLPESPRWLLMHGRVAQSERVVESIEAAVRGSGGARDLPEAPRTKVTVTGAVGLGYAVRVFVRRYPRRTVLGLALMIGQAILYNSTFFTAPLMLNAYYGVPEGNVGRYMVPFAVVNFLGPVLIGRFFDTVGRRIMIASTYAVSGLLLAGAAAAFQAGWLTAGSQTVAWSFVFFFASAAASSAYLTVSELFPVEIRGMAIAVFYTVSTAVGAAAPTIFGALIATGSRGPLFHGYLVTAAVMVLAGTVAARLGVRAEGKSLEAIAAAES